MEEEATMLPRAAKAMEEEAPVLPRLKVEVAAALPTFMMEEAAASSKALPTG